MSFIKTAKKGISVTLALMILLLSSCGNKTDSGNSDSKSDTSVTADSSASDTSSADSSESATAPAYVLPEADLQGETIRGVTFNGGNDYWQITKLSSDELNGEIINDTIYNRNIEVEKQLNVNLEFEYYGEEEVEPTIKKAIMANDDIYDYVMPRMNAAVRFAQDDLFINLNNVESIDFSNPAWDQNAVDYFTIFDKLYYGISDFSLGKNETLWVNLFNKNMLEDFRLESPYDLVKSGKWTFDKMNEMMETVHADLNNDGEFKYGDDRFGLSTNYVNYEALLIAGGEPLCEKGADGLPVITGGDDRFMAVYDKVIDLFGGANLSYVEFDDYSHDIFRESTSLFCAEVLAIVREFRDMEDDFGIIPLPKYDENQKNYYSYIVPHEVFASSIPVTAKNPENTGAVLQAMAVLSDHYLTPAYYDITIEGKGLRDEQSAEMLDIILDSAVYDWAKLCDWASFASSLGTYISNKTELAPIFSAKKKAIDKRMNRMIEDFENTQN